MIEAFYVRAEDGVLAAGPAAVEAGIPRLVGGTLPLRDLVDRGEERGAVVLVDVRGMRRRNMDGDVARAGLRGSDVWLMTHVQDEDDVFDGLLAGAARLLMPYHALDSDRVLAQSRELSDSCVPVLFVEDRTVLSPAGRTGLHAALDVVEDHGFPSCIVSDTGGSLEPGDWEAAASRHGGVLPHVSRPSARLEGMFGGIVADHRFDSSSR